MKKGILFVLVAALTSQVALAKDYAIDGVHSSANFKIKHLMSKVTGHFDDFSGEFSFDEKNPKAFTGEFTIKTTSVNTNNGDRDKHLKGDDFFKAEKFPAITFKSKEMKAAGKNKFKLSGDFTMIGVTKPVTFDVEYLGAGKDPWGNEKTGFSAVAKINRKDFGMVWNKALDAGGFVLGDDVEIEVQVEGNAKKPAEATAAKK
jgi:polyisoprenoid-binding protein YceI